MKIFIALFCSFISLTAQTEITSTGNSVANDNISIDFSLSGIPNEYLNASNFKFGVLQPQINLENGTDSLKIYNFISANGDSKNDYFEIDGLQKYPDHHLTIFNRLGNIIYESSDYKNNWNGDYYTEGGIYYYELLAGPLKFKDVIYIIKP